MRGAGGLLTAILEEQISSPSGGVTPLRTEALRGQSDSCTQSNPEHNSQIQFLDWSVSDSRYFLSVWPESLRICHLYIWGWGPASTLPICLEPA